MSSENNPPDDDSEDSDGSPVRSRSGGRAPEVLRGALVGVIAGGAGLAVGELGSVITGEAASPAVAVGQWAISLTPTWLEQFAIRNFGSDDKRMLLIGVYVVLILASAATGVLARTWLATASWLAGGFGVVGMYAAVTRPGANLDDLFPSFLAGLAAVLMLRWLTILAEEARPVADFNRTEIEALIASGQTALQAASTAADQDRLTNELDAWRNLLVDASANGATVH